MDDKQLVAGADDSTKHMVDKTQTYLVREKGQLAVRAKWADSTHTSIKVPSLRAILLIVLLVASMTAIVSVSFAVQGETPPPPGPPVSGAEGPAAWLSAWSTFWGAIAGGLAAIGTAGALLIAAFGYKHQVAEKERHEAERRQQDKDKKDAEAKALRSRARQVSLLTKQAARDTSNWVLEVHNGTSSPIRNVMFTCSNGEGNVVGQAFRLALPAGEAIPIETPKGEVDRAWVRFQDVDDKTWKIHLNGYLEEV